MVFVSSRWTIFLFFLVRYIPIGIFITSQMLYFVLRYERANLQSVLTVQVIKINIGTAFLFVGWVVLINQGFLLTA